MLPPRLVQAERSISAVGVPLADMPITSERFSFAQVIMSKTSRSKGKSGGSAAKSRPSAGGPAKPRPNLSDALESKADATEGLALARPFNELKPAEFGPAAHAAPVEGRACG